jgi:Arc/MetJ-type ribon-helix-helix transcriptional regulator
MADTEKITINLSVVDLGRIDLLVEQGFYSTRTDFIRTATRNQLDTHSEEIQQVVARKSLAVGVMGFNRADLERVIADGEQLDIRVVGMLVLKNDIKPDLAKAAIRSLKVSGAFHASEAVKEALSDRIEI